jgi:hypothetical protein
MEGNGHFIWADGRTYEGQFKDDKKSGYGIFYWGDGRKFEGTWLNGKMNGEGTYIDKKGKRRKGFWEDNKRIKWDDDGPNNSISVSVQMS